MHREQLYGTDIDKGADGASGEWHLGNLCTADDIDSGRGGGSVCGGGVVVKPRATFHLPALIVACIVSALLWLAAVAGLRALGLAPWQVAVFLALVAVAGIMTANARLSKCALNEETVANDDKT